MPNIQNQTSTEIRLFLQGSDAIIYGIVCVINGVFSLTALLGNFVALGAIWRTPSLHIASNVFLFGLALSDFGVGLIIQPSFLVLLVIEFTTETHLEKAWTAFRSTQAVFVFATVLTLTLVSVDRVIALTFHLRYRTIVTVKRACSVLPFIWIASIGYGVTIVFSARLHRYLSIAVFPSCLVVNSFAYLIIYRIARRHHDDIQAQAEQIQWQQVNHHGTLNMSRYRKSVISMFLLFILFVLCYVPYIFLRVYINFANWSPVHAAWALRLSASVVYLNSSFNPVLYCWRMRDLRMEMKRFLKALC